MDEIPSTGWRGPGWSETEALGLAPVHADWRQATGTVSHTFTHFHLELAVWTARVGAETGLRDIAEPDRCRWVAFAALQDEALPSVMRKVVEAARADAG
jgi:A/G-specific adenine glycosylase